MQKKFFAWILAAALIVSMPAVKLNAAAEDGFTDIGNHWAKDLIIKFTEQGILAGYPDGTFRPDNYLSRAESVVLLNKYFNITTSGYPNFSDVNPDDWFYFQIGSAHERGYINGYPDGTFKPTKNITRLEAFIMIYNLLGAPEFNDVSVLSRFSDYDSIPADMPMYRQIVAYMASNGIINAYPDGSLRVNDFLTRAEMLSLLDKVGDMISNTNTILPEPTPELTVTPELTQTPIPAPSPGTTNNNWPAPLNPGNYWNTTSGGLTVSGLNVTP